MRIAVGLLLCLGAGSMTSALADPPTKPSPAAAPAQAEAAAPCKCAPTAASAPSSPDAPAAQAAENKDAAAQAAAAKAAIDKDTQHFLAQGYKPEMRSGEQVYCRKDTAIGSRLTPVKNCGTIEQLKLAEQKTKAGVFDAQRQQTNPTYH